MSWRLVFDWMERDRLPDPLIRLGIRRLLRERLETLERGGEAGRKQRFEAFVDALGRSPIAVSTDEANEQHYEVPPRFFELVLGRNLKYSSALWNEQAKDLDAAEEAMLSLYEERAGFVDGMEILELGCGWGSLSLRLAARYPASRILAVSNSTPQRHFIAERAAARGLNGLEVTTCDINRFTTDRRFDRIVSIEMFEHVKNYRALLERIAGWLGGDGKLFVHIFTHRRFAYSFETESGDDWMGRHFFTDGTMPSRELLRAFEDDMQVEKEWHLSGTHYQRTAEAWLRNLDRNRAAVEELFASAYGPESVTKWVVRWRVFFMACAELWGFRGGTEWGVSHYLLEPAPERHLRTSPDGAGAGRESERESERERALSAT